MLPPLVADCGQSSATASDPLRLSDFSDTGRSRPATLNLIRAVAHLLAPGQASRGGGDAAKHSGRTLANEFMSLPLCADAVTQ
jgi:hypothetical protein